MQIQDAVAAVTGAGSGIGRALAHELATRGARLSLADIDADALAATVDDLRARDVDVIGVPTDVSDVAAVRAFADATIEHFGRVDLVVNNAGVSTFNLLANQTIDDWRWVVDVNLFGVVHGLDAFLPRLREQGSGHIVNVASIAGVQSGIAFLGPYAATKVAVVSMSETLAQELAAFDPGIGVTVVCPGSTDTAVMRSERVRPAERGAEVRTPDAEAWRSAVESSFTGPTGRTAADVAAQIADAVQEGRFWVFTHSDCAMMAGPRVASVAEALDSEAARHTADASR